MTKPRRNTTKPGDITVDDVMRTGIEGLAVFIESARDSLVVDPSNAELAASLANVTTKVATIQAEQRKSEAAARKADADWSSAAMLERVRRMPLAERRTFAAAVAAVDADRAKSGLA